MIIAWGNAPGAAPTGRMIIAWGNAPGAAPTERIIIAWGNAPGAGVYDCSQGVALGFNKAPFQG